MRRRVLLSLIALPSCMPTVTERVTSAMLWMDPPTPFPGTPVEHEPNTVDLAFAESPSNHVLLQSAPILALLRSKGSRKVQVVFDVTRSRFGSEVRGYTIVSIEGHIFDSSTDQGLGSFQIGPPGDALPFTK